MVIEKSSVSNFLQTRLYNIIVSHFNNCGDKSGNEENTRPLSEEYGALINLFSIESNEDFNYKLELTRKERISITVR